MAAASPKRNIEVIDLLSDSETEDSESPPPPPANRRSLGSNTNDAILQHAEFQAMPGAFDDLDENYNGAATLLPEELRESSPLIISATGQGNAVFDTDNEAEYAAFAENSVRFDQDRDLAGTLGQNYTADSCLQQVLEIFPDVQHEHVLQLYRDFDETSGYEPLPGPARFDSIIDKLLTAEYPKQTKGKQPLKRKRESSVESDDTKQWESANREPLPNFLSGSIKAMLKSEFQDIPNTFINQQLAAHKHLFATYVALANTQDTQAQDRPYGRGRPPTHFVRADVIAENSGWPDLTVELAAARRRCTAIRTQRAEAEAKKLAEQENLRRAMDSGQTAECSACFDDLPMNRQIHCNGVDIHFTCFDCATTYIKSEIGEARCSVICPSGCGATFMPDQLRLLEDKKMLQKLEQIQQEKEIRDANLEDIEECPFCDYKAILPPIEEDFEFRCLNPECEKVSCRRCKAVSHIPISCEQHAKDNKINSRHKLEEAMTAALIRSCNKCKNQFIKDYGCNKMTCSSCGNVQCYVCSKNVEGSYRHFEEPRPRDVKKCPLYDNVEERHEKEVKEAEAATRAAIVAENPDVSAEDLEIKMSDAVKNAEQKRIQAGRVAPGMAGYMPPPLPPGMAGVFDGLFAMDGEDGDAGFGRFPGAYRARRMHQQRQRQQEAVRLRMQAMRAGGPAAAAAPAPVPPPGFAARMQGYIPVFGFGGPAQDQNAAAVPGADNVADAPQQPPPPPQADGGPFANMFRYNPFGGFGPFDGYYEQPPLGFDGFGRDPPGYDFGLMNAPRIPDIQPGRAAPNDPFWLAEPGGVNRAPPGGENAEMAARAARLRQLQQVQRRAGPGEDNGALPGGQNAVMAAQTALVARHRQLQEAQQAQRDQLLARRERVQNLMRRPRDRDAHQNHNNRAANPPERATWHAPMVARAAHTRPNGYGAPDPRLSERRARTGTVDVDDEEDEEDTSDEEEDEDEAEEVDRIFNDPEYLRALRHQRTGQGAGGR